MKVEEIGMDFRARDEWRCAPYYSLWRGIRSNFRRNESGSWVANANNLSCLFYSQHIISFYHCASLILFTTMLVDYDQAVCRGYYMYCFFIMTVLQIRNEFVEKGWRQYSFVSRKTPDMRRDKYTTLFYCIHQGKV